MTLRFALLALAVAPFVAVAAQPTVPFVLEIEEVTANQAPALHSTSHAEDAGRWLFVTGRTNGLHGLTATPDPFPAQFANGAVVVYDLATDTRWSASLDGLDPAVAAPLRSTNAQFCQVGSTLYVVGGYGRNVAGDNVTHPTLTAINVPAIIAAVQNGTALAPHVRQLVDERFAVAGGHFIRRGDHYQLVAGNRFDGDYLGGNQVQVYTEAIRSIWLSDDGTTLSVTGYSEDSSAQNLHRRDGNVAPVVLPGGVETFSIYGGVFNSFNLPFRNPVRVDVGSHAAGTFQARFGHYTTPVLAMHDARDGSMHTTFFGGMGQFWYNESTGQIVEDGLVPFIDDIATLSVAADGTTGETVLPVGMPGYFGTNAQFFQSHTLPTWSNGVVRLEALSGRTLIGHIHGGITTDRPNPGWTGGPSEASDRVFAVFVTPQPVAAEDDAPAALLSLTQPLPNPVVSSSRMILTLGRSEDVRVELYDAVGRRVRVIHDGALAGGSHAIEIDGGGLSSGVYLVRAVAGASSLSRQVAVGR
jgi:hypothetical protein